MPKLYPHDQNNVDEFINSNVNDVDRKPFRPLLLLGIIFVVLGLLTLASYLVALSHGIV
ncbi:MAG: DUF3094 family protein [Agarilytica sp.]